MSDTTSSFNKFRAAAEILNRGRESLLDQLADDVLLQADELVEGGFHFHEFVENHGARIHFLCLLTAQLEHAADRLDEPSPEPSPTNRPRNRRQQSRTRNADATVAVSDQPDSKDEVSEET